VAVAATFRGLLGASAFAAARSPAGETVAVAAAFRALLRSAFAAARGTAGETVVVAATFRGFLGSTFASA
jgi:hypothetical protein